jgi:hypothetical protein
MSGDPSSMILEFGSNSDHNSKIITSSGGTS